MGLKGVSHHGAGFEWSADDAGGAQSQVWLDDVYAMDENSDAAREKILRYNTDDVQATWEVREWLDAYDSSRLKT